MTGHSNAFTRMSAQAVSACALIVVAAILAACAPLSSANARLAATIPAATPPSLPANCGPNEWDTLLLVSPEAGYCLRYPTNFVPNFDAAPDQSAERWRVSLSNRNRTLSLLIETSRSGGRTLDQVVAEALSQYPSETAGRVKQTPATLGGAHAIILDGLPGTPMNRQAFVIHGDRLHHLVLAPWEDPSFASRLANRQAVWDMVASSFVFLDEN